MSFMIPEWIFSLLRIVLYGVSIAGGGLLVYNLFNWGSSISQGVQQASPGLGAMIGAMGMMFAILPPMFMMMMFMQMFSSMIGMFSE